MPVVAVHNQQAWVKVPPPRRKPPSREAQIDALRNGFLGFFAGTNLDKNGWSIPEIPPQSQALVLRKKNGIPCPNYDLDDVNIIRKKPRAIRERGETDDEDGFETRDNGRHKGKGSGGRVASAPVRSTPRRSSGVTSASRARGRDYYDDEDNYSRYDKRDRYAHEDERTDIDGDRHDRHHGNHHYNSHTSSSRRRSSSRPAAYSSSSHPRAHPPQHDRDPDGERVGYRSSSTSHLHAPPDQNRNTASRYSAGGNQGYRPTGNAYSSPYKSSSSYNRNSRAFSSDYQTEYSFPRPNGGGARSVVSSSWANATTALRMH